MINLSQTFFPTMRQTFLGRLLKPAHHFGKRMPRVFFSSSSQFQAIIAQKNRVEEDLQNKNRQLEEYLQKIQEQNEQLQEIAWIQSHQMRSPVATILGLAGLFNYDDYSDPVNAEILRGLRKSTNKLDCLISEIVRKTGSLKETSIEEHC